MTANGHAAWPVAHEKEDRIMPPRLEYKSPNRRIRTNVLWVVAAYYLGGFAIGGWTWMLQQCDYTVGGIWLSQVVALCVPVGAGIIGAMLCKLCFRVVKSRREVRSPCSEITVGLGAFMLGILVFSAWGRTLSHIFPIQFNRLPFEWQMSILQRRPPADIIIFIVGTVIIAFTGSRRIRNRKER